MTVRRACERRACVRRACVRRAYERRACVRKACCVHAHEQSVLTHTFSPPSLISLFSSSSPLTLHISYFCKAPCICWQYYRLTFVWQYCRAGPLYDYTLAFPYSTVPSPLSLPLPPLLPSPPSPLSPPPLLLFSMLPYMLRVLVAVSITDVRGKGDVARGGGVTAVIDLQRVISAPT